MEENNVVFLSTDPVHKFVLKLISEVKKRPTLWYTNNLHYKSPINTDHEWGAIAEILNESKEFCKHKWQKLRAHFQREFKKVRLPDKDDTEISYLANYSGRWIYFEHLLFVREMKTKPTCNFCNSLDKTEVDHQISAAREDPEKNDEEEDKKDEIPIFDHEIKVEPIGIQEETILGYDPDASTSLFLQADEAVSPRASLVGTIKEDTGETCLKNRQNQVSDLKRKGLDSISNEEYQERIKCRKLSPAEDSDENDDDLHFFKSLLPFMTRLNPVRKLIVRNEIQTLLMKENLCDIEKDEGYS